MKQYQELLRHILKNGVDKKDRTGVGTRSIFGHQMRFDLRDNQLPIVTCKKVNTKLVVNEFLWMVVEGSTDVRWLKNRGHTFWDSWQKEDGSIGPGYGHQFRWANDIDQVVNVIDSLRSNPDSRRHIITLWNPKDVDEMALPPCHGVLIQFYSHEENGNRYLSCHMNQRSADCLLGVPTNIPFYSILTAVMADLTDHRPHELIYSIGDAHIYHNHITAAQEIVSLPIYPLPTIRLNKEIVDIDCFRFDDIQIIDYQHGPYIKLPVAV